MLPEGHEVAALDRLMQLQQEHALLDRPLAAIDMRLRRSPRAASAADPATPRTTEEANMNDMSRRVLPPPTRTADEPARPRHGRTGPFGVLDIGTTKIVCLIGRTESDGTLRVLGFGWQKGRGVRGGGIVDLEEAERAIRACGRPGRGHGRHAAALGHRQPHLRPAGVAAVQRAMAGRRTRGGRARHPPRGERGPGARRRRWPRGDPRAAARPSRSTRPTASPIRAACSARN